MTIRKITALLGLISSVSVFAELAPMEEAEMESVTGQGGVYLSGEFAFNKDGGPLWGATSGQFDEFGTEKQVRNCGTASEPEECGIRIAAQLDQGGWYVLDDLSGGFAFEGLTLRTSFRETALNYDVRDASGNPVVEAFNKEVVEIGLPKTVSLNNFKFTLAVANSGEWKPDGTVLADGNTFQQTNLFGIQMNGDITLKGNLLLFPVN
ncbi:MULTISPECIES: DUF6160 family protein [Thalassolituus]|jgi:hypothetical protein|uniref:DUF6160 family protein n=1 Tax=Thalassolituus TaxID=187492 RepID=UPI0023F2EA37|nr:DUF6160 family protein [Thalassolituus oleivorans]